MRRKAFRALALLMVCALFLGSFAFAAAPSVIEPQASNYIASKTAYIYKNGGGSISLCFGITATGPMTLLGTTRIELYTAAGRLMKIYTSSSYENMLVTNRYTYNSYVTYPGVSGESYYAVMTFYAGNSKGSDSKIVTTATVTA